MNMNLTAQQTALLDLLHLKAIDSIAISTSIKPETGLFPALNPDATLRGLRAYRANARALAQSALPAAFPVLQQLIGEDNFRYVAEDFWQAMPPERGDLAQWGYKLAEYMQRIPQLTALLDEHPYLVDVACAEWALHVASTASDAQLDAASFSLLAEQDPAQLCLSLGAGCGLMRSAYPVVAWIHLHDPRASDLYETARAAIRCGEPQAALVWRHGLRPVIAAIDCASAALIEATLQSQPLSIALDGAFAQNANFDFSSWLAAHVQSGLLMGARLLQPPSPQSAA
jgi:hypothetical protein